MSQLTKWPRIVLFTLTLLVLVGCVSTDAAPPQQPSTPQPTKPILLTDPVPDPKEPGVQWFSPTGHTLRGIFLDYWNKHGGLAQFGYPLTEEFFEPVSADNKLYKVQYFERARFEHHPENVGTPHKVLLGLLGREAAEKKSYFAGAYPPYGHAADFSWISGVVELNMSIITSNNATGCALFMTEASGTHVQLTSDRSLLALHNDLRGISGASLVVFGRPLQPDEPYRTCSWDPKAPGYMVEHVQENQTP